MHNKELLKTCFAEISKEDDVELVGQIPTTSQHSYIECWKLSTYISVAPVAEKIELYIGFPNSFPYECPDIFYFDTKYDYFPHIDYTYRRLCYLEEGITYSPDQPISVLRECIRQAKRLIEKGAKRENEDDFIKEIYSYWIGTYPNEQTIICEGDRYENN